MPRLVQSMLETDGASSFAGGEVTAGGPPVLGVAGTSSSAEGGPYDDEAWACLVQTLKVVSTCLLFFGGHKVFSNDGKLYSVGLL